MANKDKAADEIQMISSSELKPYEDAPFKVRDDENMKELVQSIKDSGILVPLIARPHAEGGYEILAGHRRAEASRQNNFEKVPVIVKNYDDDTAVILLVDSNLHREDILPSEKALAYQMKMEALSNQGKRNDLTSRQVGEKLSVDIVSESGGDSPRNVHRYLRLNNLVDNIRDMVDDKTIPFNTGVEMSYLTAKQQVELLNTIEAEDNTIPTTEECRWSYIIENAKQNDIALKIDTALSTIERNNPALRGALPDNYYSRLSLDTTKLASLLDEINRINTDDAENDIIGRIYEYFLSKFALSEGKGKGEFYTPKCIVNLIAEMIEPYDGILYDPCCGSGGMFVQSIKFVEAHSGNKNRISIYGQEYTNTTYKLAKMNLAIRGISANLGEKAANTFSNDQHKDLKADYIMANVYSFNAKITQAGKQFEEQDNWDAEYPEIQSDLLVGNSTEGIIAFPKLNDEAFSIIIDASSENYDEDIKPFTFNVEG